MRYALQSIEGVGPSGFVERTPSLGRKSPLDEDELGRIAGVREPLPVRDLLRRLEDELEIGGNLARPRFQGCRPGQAVERVIDLDRPKTLAVIAEQVFADSGVDVFLEEIARRAGVGAATLYRHFPAKTILSAL